MNIGFKKRFVAYLIDLLIIGFILGMVVTFKEKDEEVIELNKDLNLVEELYVNEEISYDDYFERVTVIIQDIDKECVVYTMVNILLIVGYFIILPFLCNGQTLGKRIFKIKIEPNEKEKLSIVNYIIRNIIINGLGYMVLMLLILYLLPSKTYFIFESIFSFIQITLVIISISMVLYRKDKSGLHDILSGTKVVSVSEA